MIHIFPAPLGDKDDRARGGAHAAALPAQVRRRQLCARGKDPGGASTPQGGGGQLSLLGIL